MQYKKFAILILFTSFFAFPALAAEFNPNNIISDAEMSNYNSMDQIDISNFLSKRKGTLKDYITVDKEGNFKNATETFFETSRRWQINPKYLLVLVQKEQSLLEDSSPSQGQYDRATGYGCPDSGGCDDRWKGFYKQVNSAAAQTRYYMDNIDEFGFRPNKAYNIDGQSVTPVNTATAGLYNYTPHIHGNLNFFNLYNQYFSMKWPDGSLLQADDGDVVYYIEAGTKRAIASKSILISRFDPKRIIETSQSELDNYEDGSPIKYLNFSLLQGPSNNIYMIVDDAKRKIVSQDIFKKAGFNEDEIIKVADADLALFKDGSDITQYTLYPTGKLMQNIKTKEIYYVLGGAKNKVINNEILKVNFSGMPITKVNPEDLDIFPAGANITLPDGEIVKSNKAKTIYVISNGMKLPILNASAFAKMKYSWKNVKIYTQQTIDIHPTGQYITGDW